MSRPAPFPLLLLIVVAALVPPATAAPPEEAVAYRASRLWTGDGPPIEDAVLVVADGRVVAVGDQAEVEVPETAREVDLGSSAVLIPGLVAAETGLGAVREDDERALTPEVRAIDGFDPFAEFDGPLSGGVTSVQLSPGRSRLMPGRGAVVKLDGPDPADRTLDPEGDLRILLSPEALNPPRIYEPPPRLASRDRPIDPTQPQLASSLAGAVAGLRSLIGAARADDPAGGTDPLLGPLAAALDDTGRLRVTAPGASEIRAALALAREFDLRLLLVNPLDLSPFLGRLDSWAGLVDGVVLDARFRPGEVTELPVPSPGDPEPTEPWEDAASLVDAGIPVAIVPATDADLGDLLFLAGQFTAGDLSESQVLRMVTASPAELLGVGDRVGTLSPGKDADFVVLSGDPFDLHSRVREVYVSGRRSWSADPESKATVIRAGSAQLGDGSTVEAPTIVVQGGMIRGVGPDASAPIDAEVFVFEDAVVTPGLLDLAADLGLGGPLSSRPPSATSSTIVLGPFPIIIEDDEEDRDFGGPSRTNVSLETKLGERLVSGDPAVAVARRGGITTVLTGPRESSSPSPVVAFKLGDEPTVLRDPAAIRFQLGGNLTTAVSGLRSTLRRAGDYAKSWEKYKTDLEAYEAKKKEYEEAKARLEAEKKAEAAKRTAEEAEKKAEAAKKESGGDSDESKDEPTGDQPPRPEGGGEQGQDEEESDEEETQEGDDPGDDDEKTEAESESDEETLPEEPKPPKEPNKVDSLEPYRALFGGDIPALVEVSRLDEIRAAVELFRDEHELDTVLLGAADAFRDLDLLAEKDLAVVVGPDLVREVDRETVNLAQVLATRGISFGFQSQAGTGSGTLPRAVRYAVRLGLGTGDALAALSSSPAGFLGLDDRIGILAPGKDADLVVWSGPPFRPSSRVLAVMIDGTWAYLDQEDDRR
ncbi:amidohydrolase family protein [Tautonia plasticadhaerens]|uniref:Imidazolonepropionase n=1 Tax=Tautonia plasticadhaerens TaxID=2527974 RepID=A0A518H130_9BACT|nr:amidohydrolase family protein [Tautonia plasticadhaerens]QDV34538.1 imidazolonepropionase [Tautonia plasticadhaerens]